MRILIASSEAVPFAKTGGLGDVCGALPPALEQLGQEPILIMPAFRQARSAGPDVQPTGVSVDIPIGSKRVQGEFLQTQLPGSRTPVYLVRQDDYFDRPELYAAAGDDYKDNCERFVFFSRAVMEAVGLLDLNVDLIHANDWQTGLVPAYLKLEYRSRPEYRKIASLITIHNIAYQGAFWHWDMELTGLDWKYFNWRQMEFYGKLNLLKTGLAFADAINTVSPRYAEEIQSAPLGSGLEGVLAHRHNVLSGILNGVDYRQWDPATDKHLAANYDVDCFATGKPKCKRALQEEVGLPVDAEAPLLAFIGRLVDQKGLDILTPVIQDWVQTASAQWVILGTGEAKYHDALSRLAERNPRKVAVRLEFSNALAHRIEAGADMFVMPSRFEPCGLNQLYSLKYGTVPIVRATGGLADTVTGATPETMAAGKANGFNFREYSTLALSETLWRAMDAYSDKQRWRQLIETGMRQDWSWKRSAQKYVELYQSAIERVKQSAGA